MRRTRKSTEVNAGSMADIAFLLLIFFLVTTTMSNDAGISRKLPRDCPPGVNCSSDINERNILRISINGQNQLMVNDELVSISEIKNKIKLFVDNNGDGSCNYCQGIQSVSSSDNPNKAVISLKNDRETSYQFYVAVQDELTKAYLELRENYVRNILKKSPEVLNDEDIALAKEAYPFVVSEAEISK
ncbi:biopolymer transporter ExbD [Mangrovimonas sp. CR14]|uniref:ExbD/TolR family protein n=1 Tax=Mangrovimonas sp. CR14 TaxID=2706120 RepID=UPI00141D8C7C|nr:biopolymer transporter ExbD [Mangrovimonas sp. CR14]NIK91815.1 biopolymer transporter ExbD [Mangrovimonas sp. CR14]